MRQPHLLILCVISAIAASSVTTMVYLLLTLPEVRELRGIMTTHLVESDNVHGKMMDFMSAGPRYSKLEGLLVCEAVNGLYLEHQLQAPLDCE